MLQYFVIKNGNNLCKVRRISHLHLVLRRRVCQNSSGVYHREEQIKEPQVSPIATIDILGSGHRNISPSVVLNTSQSCYLFNCGENTSRCMQESSHKRYKLQHLFLTGLSWPRVGGLPGLILNLGGGSQKIINCYGPSKLERFFKISEFFTVLPKSQVVCHDHTQMPFEDGDVRIEPVAFYSSGSSNNQETTKVNVPMPSNKPWYTDIDNEILSQMKNLEGQQSWKEYIAYICKLENGVNHILTDKIKEKGIDQDSIPNEAYIELAQMKDFILPSGEKLLASEVVQPAEPGPVFIIMECPEIDIMESVIENSTIKKYQATTADNEEDIASVVVHMTPPHILDNPNYRKWMKEFGSKTEHLILNEDSPLHYGHKFVMFREKLNLIDGNIFPLLSNDVIEAATKNGTEENRTVEDGETRVTYGEFNLKYHLKPNKIMDRSLLTPVDLEESVMEAKSVPDFEKTLEEFRSKIAELPRRKMGVSYPEVIFLGTGSASPSLYRNSSGILINISSHKSMLLDCGEGTFYQLYKMYGENVDAILSKIECIYTSHGHPDHHLGIVEILSQRHKLYENHPPELTIVCSRKVSHWLNEYNYLQKQSFLTNVRVLEPSFFRGDGRTLNFNSGQKLATQLGLQKIETAQTLHYAHPYAVAITHQDGWKIVYSGDTKSPCSNLIKLGKDATLLIHEATLEDDYVVEARNKRHSTTSQAITAAEEMGAEFLILTHFSQRYNKLISDIERDEIYTYPRLGVAFDIMKVNFEDFPVLNNLLPVFRTLFQEEILELNSKKLQKFI